MHDWSPMSSAFLGKHETGTWETGTGDTHIRTRVTIGYPNLQAPKQIISASECGQNPCNPPVSHVAFGTNRAQYVMEQWVMNSQPFCLTQLRYNTDPQGQATEIINGFKKIPDMSTSAFIRNRAFTASPAVGICGPVSGSNIPITFVPNLGVNVTSELTQINLGSAANLPTSQLTFPYLDYITTTLGLAGYHEKPSGLARGIYNLITGSRAWFKMTNGNDSMKNMMALTETGQASGLYKIGYGIQVPFGNYAPSLDMVPARFQLMTGGSGGLLQQVQPMINVTTGTTGTRQIPNPAYIGAKFELGFIWHPGAVKIWTPEFAKIHPLVPSVNSALFGKWNFINNPGAMIYTNSDGTTCTYDNVDQNYFYWRTRFEMGFEYLEPQFVIPILYQVDGSGLGSIANDPTCLTTPTYVAQNYSDNPSRCD